MSSPGFSSFLEKRQQGKENFCQSLLNIGSDGNINNNRHMLFSSTITFVSLDRQIIGAVTFEDKLRQETIEVICRIKAMNIHFVMLTGDSESIAERIANQAGIE